MQLFKTFLFWLRLVPTSEPSESNRRSTFTFQ